MNKSAKKTAKQTHRTLILREPSTEQTSCSAPEAAVKLGISLPTLKELVRKGQLPSFRTPGGHLRIPVDALNSLSQRPTAPTASTSLGIRRDRLEEKKIELEELRITNQTEKIQAERNAEERRRRKVERIREAERQAKIEESRKAQEAEAERRRQESLEEEQRQFERDWSEHGRSMLPEWLSMEEYDQVMGQLATLISGFSVEDSGRMPNLLKTWIVRILAPFKRDHAIRERRSKLLEHVIQWSFSAFANPAEKARATQLVREALDQLPFSRTESEEAVAAQEAIRPLNEEITRRRQAAVAAEQSRRQAEQARLMQEAQKRRDEAQTEAQQSKKKQLVQRGLTERTLYLLELQNNGTISDDEGDEDADGDGIDEEDLRAAVESELLAQLSGEESGEYVDKLVRRIIDEALGLRRRRKVR